jgi:hypothetical protein
MDEETRINRMLKAERARKRKRKERGETRMSSIAYTAAKLDGQELTDFIRETLNPRPMNQEDWNDVNG